MSNYDYGLHAPQPSFPPPAMEPPPARNRNRLYLLIGGSLAVVVIVIVAIFALSGGGDRPLKVSIALIDLESDCSGGTGGYDDIGPGMPVTVRDETGKIIGSSTLPDHGESLGEDGMGCEWSTVVVVTDDAKQYAVEGGHRGAVTYSHAKLEKEGWKASLSIGGA